MKWLYEILSAVIVLGTSVDIFWSVALSSNLPQGELNPLARWVITNGDSFSSAVQFGVGLLCGIKVVSTWIVLGVCKYMTCVKPKWALIILTTLALFQVWLMWFLCN